MVFVKTVTCGACFLVISVLLVFTGNQRESVRSVYFVELITYAEEDLRPVLIKIFDE